MSNITKFSGEHSALVASDHGVVKRASGMKRPDLRGKVMALAHDLPPAVQKQGLGLEELLHELGVPPAKAGLVVTVLMQMGWRCRKGREDEPLVLFIVPWCSNAVYDFLWKDRKHYFSDAELADFSRDCHL